MQRQDDKLVAPLYPQGFYTPLITHLWLNEHLANVYLNDTRKGGLLTKEQAIALDKTLSEKKNEEKYFSEQTFTTMPYSVIRNSKNTAVLLELPLFKRSCYVRLIWLIHKEEWAILKSQHYTKENQDYINREAQFLAENNQLHGEPIIVPDLECDFEDGKDLAKTGMPKKQVHHLLIKLFPGLNLEFAVNSKIPIPFLFQIAIDISEYLKYKIHDKGFFHCDIKPSNILVNIITGRGTLIDFGSLEERAFMNGKFADGILTTRHRKTQLFVAPNLVSLFDGYNPKKASFVAKDDVYSLGISLFVLFGGKNYRYSKETYDWSAIQEIDKILETSHCYKTGTGQLQSLLKTLMSGKPEDRFDLVQTIAILKECQLNFSKTPEAKENHARILKEAKQQEISRLNKAYITLVTKTLNKNNALRLIKEEMTFEQFLKLLPFISTEEEKQKHYKKIFLRDYLQHELQQSEDFQKEDCLKLIAIIKQQYEIAKDHSNKIIAYQTMLTLSVKLEKLQPLLTYADSLFNSTELSTDIDELQKSITKEIGQLKKPQSFFKNIDEHLKRKIKSFNLEEKHEHPRKAF